MASRTEVEEIQAGRTLAAEVGPMARLAGPVVLAELGWMAMGLVDVAMVGRLGAEAIGAVGLGNHLFMGVTILGIGMLLGLDTVVSQAFGAKHPEVCHRALTHGSLLALLLAPPLMGAIWAGSHQLGGWGIDARVAARTIPYVDVVIWSVPPLLLGTASRRYLQGMNLVRPAMVSLLAANAVNLAGNWMLVYGHLGAPRLGVVGSGWATLLARWVMAAIVMGAALRRDRREATGRRPGSGRFDGALLGRLLALGGPAACQLGIEVGAFATASVLAGRLGAAALAAHEVALNVCSLAFMVPLGISSAGAVRVGQALGRGDPRAAGRAGWVALALGASFMAVSSSAFLLIPRAIFGTFTGEPAVLALGVPLLLIAAIFQLFDGVQVVAGGLLRGAGDTRTPMLANAVAYWVLGLPIAAGLAFWGDLGVIGLWIGLCTGLIVVSSLLLLAWARAVRELARDRPSA